MQARKGAGSVESSVTNRITLTVADEMRKAITASLGIVRQTVSGPQVCILKKSVYLLPYPRIRWMSRLGGF